jgi:uncharacterized hydrophobic protein (TIGR00271 family)
VLQLRVYGEAGALADVAERLRGLPGARHVGLSADGAPGTALVTADLGAEAADAALATVDRLGVPPEDVTLVRLETVGPAAAAEPLAVVWADVLGQARVRARMPARYLVLMAAAGVIAGLGVINRSSILVVGAMATSPDLLPVTAACTGLVLRRPRLAGRGLGVLAVGLAATCAAAALVALLLDLLDRLPPGFTVREIPAAQTHVSATTIIVALAAGVAGMLAVETRASSAVGVAISVTTIPASAYLGVAVGIGQLGKAWSALPVLAVNVAMMLLGGSLTLATQRLRS